MPHNKIKQDFHFTTLKRFKIIKLPLVAEVESASSITERHLAVIMTIEVKLA
jgi:hypothetical protein